MPADEKDPVMSRLCADFGENVVFVPLPTGGSPSSVPEWSKQPFSPERQLLYMQALKTSDIGLQLGQATQLVGIHFNDKAALQSFMALNPTLKTLTTLEVKGVSCWLFLDGVHVPPTQQLPDCLWRGSGVFKIYDRATNTLLYKIETAAPIARVPLADLVWPRATTDAFQDQIVASEYGLPAQTDKRGKSIPNLLFFARLFAVGAAALYVSQYNSFYLLNVSASRMQFASVHEIKQALARFLMRYDAQFPQAELFKLAQPEGLVRLVEALRTVAVGNLPAEDDVLSGFIRQGIVRDENANITTDEIFSAQELYCGSRNIKPLPRVHFERFISTALKNEFGVEKSHSILRDGGWRRGFRTIRMNGAFLAPVGTAGTAGTPVSTIAHCDPVQN